MREEIMTNTEQMSATKTEKFFKSRAKRADFGAFDRILCRKGGEAPNDEYRLD